MTNIVRRMFLSPRTTSGSNRKVVKSREDIVQEDFLEWSIPNERIENIYSIGTFDFKTSYAIKIHEETFNIQNKSQTIQLLSKLALQEFLKKGFHYIHFGLIQIAIKPLVHTGVDIPVYTALRDKRLKRYKSSILSMIQTNICNGPVYINCMPNY